MPRDVPSEPRSWLLQRRSTLSLRQLPRVFAALCAPSLLVALTFLWLGYWYILMYSLLELAALWLCMRHQARHADDYDRIDIAPGVILVEQRRAGGLRLILLDPRENAYCVPLHLPEAVGEVSLSVRHSCQGCMGMPSSTTA